jgi:hypothetical protein
MACVSDYSNTSHSQGQTLTATSTVFSWPTRLISEVQLLRAITAAMNTNPLLLVAFEAVMCAPSGDQLIPKSERFLIRVRSSLTHLSRRKNVLPGESSKGFRTSASSSQSVVRQILTLRSSDCVAKNSPTGSQQTPFTKPRC